MQTLGESGGERHTVSNQLHAMDHQGDEHQAGRECTAADRLSGDLEKI